MGGQFGRMEDLEDFEISSGQQSMAGLETINFNDFLCADDMDDISLSQACETIEKEYEMLNELNVLSLTQTLEQYDIKNDIKLDREEYGDLLIKSDLQEEFTRFVEPVTDSEIKELIDSQENANTKKNTAWSVRVFEMWRDNRNSKNQGIIPELKTMTSEEMNYYLGRFIVEARKKDGSPYPPRSLYLISCGLLRHLRDSNVYDKNFLDPKNLIFSEFRKILDAKMKELLSKGYGSKIKQAQPLLPDDESVIWEKGVFGDCNAETLQCTIFFYACKLFGLRGHDEHHALDCDQFLVGEDHRGKFIEFHGRANKTFKGGLMDLQLSNKTIKHYCQDGK